MNPHIDVDFWQNQNKKDNAIGLFCQSCCYCYPNECDFIELLHPYDRLAEICPDFVPKDMYKPKSKAKCWILRLKIDSRYKPLPDGDIWHPYYKPFAYCNSTEFFKIMTKKKAYRFLEASK